MKFLLLTILICLPLSAFAEPSYKMWDEWDMQCYSFVTDDGQEVVKSFITSFGSFDTGDYKIYCQYLEGFYAGNKEKAFRIDSSNIGEVIQSISSKEEALELVRIFTHWMQWWAFDMPFEMEVDYFPWLSEAVNAKLPEALEDPRVLKDGDGFVVERNLIMFGEDGKRGVAPYKLIRSKETVLASGEYEFEVEEVIVEAKWLNEYNYDCH